MRHQAFEYLIRCFRAAHGKGQGRGVAEHTDHDISLDRLQKQFEIVPPKGDEQDQNQYGSDDCDCGYERHKPIGEYLLNARQR